MILKQSISNAKNFFQKTIESFKSFLGGGYQRLPKTPPCNPFSCAGNNYMNRYSSSSFRDLEKFYAEFTNQLDTNGKEKFSKKRVSTKKTKEEYICNGSFMRYAKPSPTKETEKNKRSVYEAKEREPIYAEGDNTSEERRILVAQKLKELEMMDLSNVEHVLDIQEILHYYTRLTCPAYLDIVDKFFMDMYSEIFGPSSASNGGNSSRARFRLLSRKL